ncbi:hypothetical protein C8N32_11028 [Rhodovulum imhoffii]|uniref:Uncharacterized protein n=1 Tax=Rhodovulum imhoffii TaxID=365340 RepID=A0A2T5BR77_9RHOB|nr:hypothetical protein [Rhodovulum imhoffii]MBK5934401.1 hypothetical protein [Rhodovulum imhoffii]PTN01747.1 hypothetical protein C8N32_11028 [Rhodovulum imhoffii]
MTPKNIESLFTRADGQYLFARWGRPIAPVVFGVADETLKTVKGAVEAVVALAAHKMTETDPELGANLMMFFIRDWEELIAVPNMDHLVPDLVSRVARLREVGATQYRFFRFDEAGAIKAAFVFIRMDAALAALPAEEIALAQAVQVVLLWSETAFSGTSALGRLADGTVVLRPDIAAVIRAAYDPAMPPVARDPGHALRLFARVERAG